MKEYEALMEITEPYCFESGEQEDFTTGLTIPAGWWMSELAKKDYELLDVPEQSCLWTLERMKEHTELLFSFLYVDGKKVQAITPLGLASVMAYREYVN